MSDNLVTRLPDYYQSSPPVSELERALGAQAALLMSAKEDTQAQLWIETATWGLDLWEQWAGLPVDRTQGYQARRSRVLAKLMGQGTTTAELLHGIAQAYVDADVQIWEKPSEYRFTVVFSDIQSQPPVLDDLSGSMNEIKPAHLDYDYLFLYDFQAPLEVLQTIASRTMIYHYKLGSWLLGDKPFGEMEGEVTLVSGPMQIKDTLLEMVAHSVAEQVAKARVNGEVEISDFEVKAASDNMAAIRYYLQPETTPELTQLELLDADGTVLTAVQLNVLLRGPTLISHLIPVAKGAASNG